MAHDFPASEHDLAPALAALIPEDLRVRVLQGGVLVHAAGAGAHCAIAVVDPSGPVTDPGVPSVRLFVAGDGSGELPMTSGRASSPANNPAKDAAAAAAIQAAVDTADQSGTPRLVALTDPMDRPRQRLFEAAGFRTGDRQPYFDQGGGLIEYVTGYTDATGAVLELVRDRPLT